MFNGEIDFDSVFAELARGGTDGVADFFPLRVQIGTPSAGQSLTGGLVAGGFTALAGHESVPGQRENAETRTEEITTPSGKKVVISHVWTLPGAWPQISEKYELRELDAEGNAVAYYEIATADVHAHNIHTVLRTKRVKRN